MNMMKYKKFGGSARRTPTKIIFNRKVYTLFSVQKSKQNALDFKREFKRRGFLIRVIKNGKNYELYKSNSIKNKRKRVVRRKNSRSTGLQRDAREFTRTGVQIGMGTAISHGMETAIPGSGVSSTPALRTMARAMPTMATIKVSKRLLKSVKGLQPKTKKRRRKVLGRR